MPANHVLHEWLSEHSATLHRIARTFAAPADEHDLLQEILLSLWKAAPAFRGESSSRTFVYRVALNRALTWRRKERLRWSRMQTFPPGAEPNAIEPPDERLDRLYAAIRQLGLMDRALILLSLEGLSYRDIAALHGISESNTGARLTRIRTKLSALIEATDNDV